MVEPAKKNIDEATQSLVKAFKTVLFASTSNNFKELLKEIKLYKQNFPEAKIKPVLELLKNNIEKRIFEQNSNLVNEAKQESQNQFKPKP